MGLLRGTFRKNGDLTGAQEAGCRLCEWGADHEVVQILGQESVQGGFVVWIVWVVVVVPG